MEGYDNLDQYLISQNYQSKTTIFVRLIGCVCLFACFELFKTLFQCVVIPEPRTVEKSASAAVSIVQVIPPHAWTFTAKAQSSSSSSSKTPELGLVLCCA
jgi:hypothetical protein